MTNDYEQTISQTCSEKLRAQRLMLRLADSSKHPDYLNNKMFTLALSPYVSDNKTPTGGFLLSWGVRE